MNKEQILKKAIAKAQKNGWDCDVSEEQLCITRYFQIIFSHDFAKAFWGEQEHEATEIRYEVIGCGHCPLQGFPDNYRTKYCWQYHLQQMVLTEDPLKYLEQFLDE